MSGIAQPVASAHLFRFRAFRDAARSLFTDRRTLQRIEGLLFARLVFVGGRGTEGFTLGVVDPRLQMALCVWRDERALERFHKSSALAGSWRTAGEDYCEVRMTPFRASGTYHGEAPLSGLHQAPRGDGAVALWTFANIPPRGLFYFWSRIRPATRRLLNAPGLIAGTAGPERWYSGAMTFTLWSSLDDALRFAYREEPHRRIVKEVGANGLLTDSMFIRLRPYSIAGRWPRGSRFSAGFEEYAHSLASNESSIDAARSPSLPASGQARIGRAGA